MIELLIDIVVVLFFAIIVFICATVIMLFIECVNVIMVWSDTMKNSEKISFKSFVSFYNIAPDKWVLGDNFVTRKGMYPKYCYSHGRDCYSPGRDQDFCFSFCDYLRYKKWHKKWLKEKEQNKSNEIMAKLIEEVRKDLEEYNRKGF